MEFQPTITSRTTRFMMINHLAQSLGGLQKLYDGQFLYVPFQLSKEVTCSSLYYSSDCSRCWLVLSLRWFHIQVSLRSTHSIYRYAQSGTDPHRSGEYSLSIVSIHISDKRTGLGSNVLSIRAIDHGRESILSASSGQPLRPKYDREETNGSLD